MFSAHPNSEPEKIQNAIVYHCRMVGASKPISLKYDLCKVSIQLCYENETMLRFPILFSCFTSALVISARR